MRARLFAFGTLLAFAISAAAFAGSGGNEVRIAFIKGPSGIGATWLLASPPELAPPGTGLRFILASGADQVTAKLVSGEIDGGALPLNIAAKLYNSGIPIRLLAVTGEGMVRLLSRDTGIGSFEDLKGREIHIAGQKATPDYLFRYLAEKEGIDPDRDFRLSYKYSYAEAAAGLAAGKIRCAVLPEPFATQARLLDPAIREPFELGKLWTSRTGMDSYPMTVFVVSSRLIESNPDATARIAAAYRDSVARTVAAPEETAQLAESLDLGIKAAVAAPAIPRSAYTFRVSAEARESIERMLSIFLSFDPESIGGRLPDSRFYATAPIPSR